MGLMADGGGIYLLGWQPGMIVEDNRILHVRRHPEATGSANAAIFLDQGTKGVTVRRNRWQEISGDPLRFNGTRASVNMLEDNQEGP